MPAASPLTRCLICFSAVVTFVVHLSAPLLACAPGPPDPWFRERISTMPTSLPPGVGVRVVRMRRDGSASDYVEITNRSATPLYVLAATQDRPRISTALPVALPAGRGALYQIANGQVFTWDSFLNVRTYPQPGQATTQPRPGGWVASQARPSDVVLLTIADNVLKIDEAPSYGISEVSRLAARNRTGDARPADVALPAAQAVMVPLLYGIQLIEVPIAVTYALNPSYRPNSVAQPDGCRGGSLAPIAIFCFAGLLAVVLFVALYWSVSTAPQGRPGS